MRITRRQDKAGPAPQSFAGCMDRGLGHVSTWREQHGVLCLHRDEVHVWRASLDITSSRFHQLRGLLADDEMERADRFRFEKDRLHFMAARGFLRTLIGRYSGIRPELVRFKYGPYGKPALSSEDPSSLCLNISHSRSVALFAFTLGRDIGVDIEFMRSGISADDIAGRFFSPEEKTALDSLPPDIKLKAFYSCWSRKEAFLKANGKGLSYGLDRVEVSVDPKEAAGFLRINGSETDASLWTLCDLPAPHGYSAALALKGRDLDIKLYQLPERE